MSLRYLGTWNVVVRWFLPGSYSFKGKCVKPVEVTALMGESTAFGFCCFFGIITDVMEGLHVYSFGGIIQAKERCGWTQ